MTSKNFISPDEIETLFLTEKKNVTTTLPVGLEEYANNIGVPLNQIIEIGLRNFFIGENLKFRISQLESLIKRLDKLIAKLTSIAELLANEGL